MELGAEGGAFEPSVRDSAPPKRLKSITGAEDWEPNI